MSPEVLFFLTFGGGLVLTCLGYALGVDARKKWQKRYSNLQEMHIKLQKDHLQHLSGSKRVVNKYVSLVDAWNQILALAIEGKIALHPAVAKIIKKETEGSIYELYHKEE